MVIEIVVFDWDSTLAEELTTDLFPGALELLKTLIQKGIRIRILTGRPGKDPTPAIFTALQQNRVNIAREDVIWAGAVEYQGHGTTGENKTYAIEQIQQAAQVNKDQILFIDDRQEYIKAVEKNGFPARQVPEETLSVNVRENNAVRQRFYTEVQNQILGISNSPVRNTQEDISLVSASNQQENIGFFKRHPILKKALIGAAIGFGALCLLGGIAAAIAFSGGAAAPVIIGAGLIAIKTLGIVGTIGVGAGAALTVTGAGAGIGAIVGAVQDSGNAAVTGLTLANNIVSGGGHTNAINAGLRKVTSRDESSHLLQPVHSEISAPVSNGNPFYQFLSTFSFLGCGLSNRKSDVENSKSGPVYKI